VPVTKILICAWGVLAGFAAAAQAQTCPVSSAIRARLTNLNQYAGKPGYNFQTGDVWLDANCFAEARYWLNKAREEVNVEPESNEPARGDRLSTIDGCLALLNARQSWAQGDPASAKSQLLKLISTYTQDRVTTRAILTLEEVLENQPDATIWVQIRPKLETFLSNPFLVGTASRALVNYLFLTKGADAAIAYIREMLSRAQPVQVTLQLRIRLGQSLNLAGRSAEARILVQSLESQLGAELLDPNARVEFLRLGADVWRKRATATPSDTDAAARAVAYADALRRAESEL
jgi:hypothetical protein